MIRLLTLCALASLACHPALIARAEIAVEKTADGVIVTADGKPFATYLTKSGSKPIVWPVYGPTGKRMTRNWPMEKDVPGETDRDHKIKLIVDEWGAWLAPTPGSTVLVNQAYAAHAHQSAVRISRPCPRPLQVGLLDRTVVTWVKAKTKTRSK